MPQHHDFCFTKVVSKLAFNNSVANFAADIVVTRSNIVKCCKFFFLFIEVNNKRTFWPSFTEVVLLLMGQILNIVKILLKYVFTVS